MATESATNPASEDNTPRRWPKHALWMGVAITIAGFMSYYLYFAQFADLRDFPVVNLPLVLLGVIVTAAGCWGVFKQGTGLLGKGLAGLGLLFTLAIAGLFNWYLFSFSYSLPESLGAPAVNEMAPEFTLLDHDGRSVSLSDYRGKKVVISFYRGDW